MHAQSSQSQEPNTKLKRLLGNEWLARLVPTSPAPAEMTIIHLTPAATLTRVGDMQRLNCGAKEVSSAET